MNAESLNVFTHEVAKDAAFGLSVLAIVLLLTTSKFVRIFIGFSRACANPKVHTTFHLTSRFLLATVLICITQVLAILIWTMALYLTDLIGNINSAILFAGSCFTTLGIFTTHLPAGWQSISFYIAFSGLFSFAMATSVLISMMSTMGKKI